MRRFREQGLHKTAPFSSSSLARFTYKKVERAYALSFIILISSFWCVGRCFPFVSPFLALFSPFEPLRRMVALSARPKKVLNVRDKGKGETPSPSLAPASIRRKDENRSVFLSTNALNEKTRQGNERRQMPTFVMFECRSRCALSSFKRVYKRKTLGACQRAHNMRPNR